jgi:hypothetical protein
MAAEVNFSEEFFNRTGAVPTGDIPNARKKGRSVEHTYQKQKPLEITELLTLETKTSALYQFVELVQGGCHLPLERLVIASELKDGILTVHKLSSLFKYGMFQATVFLGKKCDQYNVFCPTEREIIENSRHPYYQAYVDKVISCIVISFTNDDHKLKSIRRDVGKYLAGVCVNQAMEQVVRDEASGSSFRQLRLWS